MLTNIVFLFATSLSTFNTFYFGYKILKTNWGTNTKIIMFLLLILGSFGLGLAVVFILINSLGLDVHN